MKRYSEIKIGNKISDYTIISYEGIKNNNKYYKIRCAICGNEKICAINNLRKQDNHHSALNCGINYYAHFIGKQFGDFKVINITHTNHGFMLECKCIKCNHIIFRNLYSLQAGSNKHSYINCKEDYINSFIGKQFGDFKIISFDGYYNNDLYYVTECIKCSEKMKASLHSLKKHNFIHGPTCIKLVPNSSIKYTIISRFNDMKSRCENPNNEKYKYYGGKGIKLEYKYSVDLYHDFIDEFIEHAAKHGIKNTTFDRIDVNGNYCKSNLRLTTQEIQNVNCSDRRFFIIEKNNTRVISDSAMYTGRKLNINGRSLGNMLRGNSKSAGGRKLVKILYNISKDNIEDIIKKEGVTTNLVISL